MKFQYLFCRSFTVLFICLWHITIPNVAAQQLIVPLTPKEVSERLLPPFRLLAFAPITAITYESVLENRKRQNSIPIPTLTNSDSVDVLYLKIPGFTDKDPLIPVRIYKPKNKTNIPFYIYFHGGGFVEGSLNWDHQRNAKIAQSVPAIVISVDYRLAPENKFPAALNDGYAVLLWVARHGQEYGGDTSTIAVGGASAGAGIAGSVVLKARDESGPKIKLQVLEIPPIDLDTTRRSVREFFAIPGLKGADLPILIKMYVGDSILQKPVLPKYLLPGITNSFRGLPPTLIVTCGVDPLRDGGLFYAQKLLEAGNALELHNYAGYAHGMGLPGYDVELFRVMKQWLRP